MSSQFHSFLQITDRLRATDTIPGIVIPQEMCQDYQRKPNTFGKSFAIFYSPEDHNSGKTVIGTGLGWQRPSETCKLGVRLQDALKLPVPQLKCTISQPDGLFSTPRTLQFMLMWPGHHTALYSATRTNFPWTAPELVYEVARWIQEFYDYARHYEYGDKSDLEWSPAAIPFEKLYLIELWQVQGETFQPVLAYDAD